MTANARVVAGTAAGSRRSNTPSPHPPRAYGCGTVRQRACSAAVHGRSNAASILYDATWGMIENRQL